MSVGLQEGAVFAGRYRIIRHIAAGAMGAVYEVEHLGTHRRRALKVMLPHVGQRPALRERFEREAKVTAGVSNEFIVEVFDAGIDEATQTPFLVMELLRGEDLAERLKRMGQLSPDEVIHHLQQTALALDETHRASIVHRDLKPGNLFLAERPGREPIIKVLDFGVAKIIAESATSGGATQAVGTPHYMAPEQFRSGSVSAATDIYALGMIAYALLAGEAYWADEKRQSDNLLSFALTAGYGPKELASVRAARRGVVLPAEFDAWFARATAAQPARRFARATGAVHALADVFGLPQSVAAVSAIPGTATEEEAAVHTRAADRERTLRDYIGEQSIPVQRRVRWLVDLARLLAAAHRSNRLHGSLTPDGVIIGVDGSLSVPHLELARGDDSTMNAPTGGTLPGTGAIAEPPWYVAPEQLEDQPISDHTDQFAWGVVAYELLAGTPPWSAHEADALRDQILHAAPAPLHEHTHEVPDQVERVMLRALEKRPAHRYATLQDVALALEPFADTTASVAGKHGNASSVRPGFEAAQAAPGKPRARRRTLILAAVPVALAASLGVVLLRHRAQPAAARPVSPLAPLASVLACPILEASGVVEPTGWLGAAAAATLCERARVILGGTASRTLVPAELLDLPLRPVDSFPVDPYAGAAARARSLDSARTRAAAYIDGRVIKEASGFRVSLVLHRADGHELARTSGAGSALYQAVREAMTPLVQPQLVPRAASLDPVVVDWSRARDIDGALALLDVTLAMVQNAGGVSDECARVEARSADLGEMGPAERWLCAYTLGLPPPPSALLPTDSASPAEYVTRARLYRRSAHDHDREIGVELQRLLEREPNALGRSVIAATGSCALQSSDPKRAHEMALLAVQADPKNPLGEFCAPWSQLVAVALDTASAGSTVRAMQAWTPWDSRGWALQPPGSGHDPSDAGRPLAYARRAYALSPFDTNVVSVLVEQLLSRGEREEVRNIAVATARGGYPVHLLASDLLLVRVDASEARFTTALERARRAMQLEVSDAGWVRALRFDVAWRAVELGAILGHADEVADLVVERFLDPDAPPLDGNSVNAPARIPAVCALASKAVRPRCFARFRALRGQLSGGVLSDTDAFATGAERYAAGDVRGAAKAWRPLLRQPGLLASVLPGAMAATFERTGDVQLSERVEAAAEARSQEFNGASPALVWAAHRAAARGDRARARMLANRVIDAWMVADATVPAVEEMRKLLAGLR